MGASSEAGKMADIYAMLGKDSMQEAETLQKLQEGFGNTFLKGDIFLKGPHETAKEGVRQKQDTIEKVTAIRDTLTDKDYIDKANKEIEKLENSKKGFSDIANKTGLGTQLVPVLREVSKATLDFDIGQMPQKQKQAHDQSNAYDMACLHYREQGAKYKQAEEKGIAADELMEEFNRELQKNGSISNIPGISVDTGLKIAEKEVADEAAARGSAAIEKKEEIERGGR